LQRGIAAAMLRFPKGNSKENQMTDANELADRYVAMWTEADAERRRAAIAEHWTEDAVHILDPPQEARQAAAALDITPTFQARGHRELEDRMARAYKEFIAPGEFTFRHRDNVGHVGDAVKFSWEMVPASGGEAVGVGLEFLILAPDGRIRLDYQFIER
jgi:hypothetical protein